MFQVPFLFADKVLKGIEKLDGTQITAMTLIGLLVVFSALLILVIYLYCSGSAFKAGGKKQPPVKPAAPAKTEVKPAAPAKAAPAPAPAEDDTEVIAVIMAAIAAMGEAEGKQYRIRSVKPVQRSDARSIWAQAGRSDMTRPF